MVKTFGKFILDDIRSKTLNDHMKNIDYVYHFAGIAPLPNCQEDPYEAVDVNVSGTANVFRMCKTKMVLNE
jgi:UDP-glucose 4-epimerase